jgi:succinate dehydrogenase/fumarate reductase cytochrome b subunit
MFTVALFIALSLSALAALPGDWARRNSTPKTANVLNLANGLAMLVIIALAATLGVAHGVGGILGILSGIGTGQQLADGLANRKWGTPARPPTDDGTRQARVPERTRACR